MVTCTLCDNRIWHPANRARTAWLLKSPYEWLTTREGAKVGPLCPECFSALDRLGLVTTWGAVPQEDRNDGLHPL